MSGPEFQIPPDAVRVWRGFRSPDLAQADFFQRLSTVFVPATVEMQIEAGLDVYVPTIPCGLQNKPDTVPDETAILFWDSQQTYHDGFDTLAVRTYTLTHGAVYTKESRADFPSLFSGKLEADQPAYLFDRPADWMHGCVRHVIAGPPAGKPLEDFFGEVTRVVQGVQERGVAEGAIVCVGADYVVYWQLGGADDPAPSELAKLAGWSVTRDSKPTRLEKGLWEVWAGMAIQPGDSFNMQFQRRWER